eukprot:XP_001692813.1 predicted protein [Chlamydomonas reinhardtii]
MCLQVVQLCSVSRKLAWALGLGAAVPRVRQTAFGFGAARAQGECARCRGEAYVHLVYGCWVLADGCWVAAGRRGATVCPGQDMRLGCRAC